MARTRSNLWFILPVVFSLIGGIIGYFILKKDDEHKADEVFILGLLIFGASIAFGFLLGLQNKLNVITPFGLLG